MLLDPVLDHEVAQVAFIIYSKERHGVRALAEELVDRFDARGVYVVDALHADGSRWFPVLPGFGETSTGVPYDSSTNPIALQAVVDGQVTVRVGRGFAASLLGDPTRSRPSRLTGRTAVHSTAIRRSPKPPGFVTPSVPP